ncbi:hypothetical protein B0H17DRAFT_1052574 [Mycena rosella]|uniref:Secreted protein n=1 Tax=Mycena rosella TaxID=1033263 RepID=A0AAD7DQV1_MYCRO|nr:hypothetical protein B0H17DRAFT_1052574 [Mycena rosella]
MKLILAAALLSLASSLLAAPYGMFSVFIISLNLRTDRACTQVALVKTPEMCLPKTASFKSCAQPFKVCIHSQTISHPNLMSFQCIATSVKL